MKDWYECVEEPIRPLVKLLRENGINTTCSCGHGMYCECEYYGEPTKDIWVLLVENGYKKFRIEVVNFYDEKMGNYNCLTIKLPLPDGYFVPQMAYDRSHTIVIHDPDNHRNIVVDVSKGGCQYFQDLKIVETKKNG